MVLFCFSFLYDCCVSDKLTEAPRVDLALTTPAPQNNFIIVFFFMCVIVFVRKQNTVGNLKVLQYSILTTAIFFLPIFSIPTARPLCGQSCQDVTEAKTGLNDNQQTQITSTCPQTEGP